MQLSRRRKLVILGGFAVAFGGLFYFISAALLVQVPEIKDVPDYDIKRYGGLKNSKNQTVGDIVIKYTFNDTLSVRRPIFAEAWAKLENVQAEIPTTVISETGEQVTRLEKYEPIVLAIQFPTAREFEQVFDIIKRPEDFAGIKILLDLAENILKPWSPMLTQ